MPQSSIDSLPPYLRRYCVRQDYSKYTSRDHAAWRYIMRQSRDYFRDHAVSIYLDGLRKTGISIDRIPKVSEMDLALSEFGWGAVPVCGFIPPAAFLDLQARGILPIATDMRTIDHIAYTPAPDIVHEAAGHAPIIADKAYRNYLRKYAAMASKAVMSCEDLALYEAIRVLSDIKENPDTNPRDIAAAQLALNRAVKNISYASEASKVARMAWWTVEYGLVGDINSPKIYGAGLLSSIGESQACLKSSLRKIPLTVKCVDVSYDITEPQPQLFVAEDMNHLSSVLKDLEQQMSYQIGGIHGLEEMRRAKTVNTIELDSGLQISGCLNSYEATMDGQRGSVHFLKLSGPCQLAVDGVELSGQGPVRHAHGFSTPLGRWVQASHKSPANFSDEELRGLGITIGQRVVLHFVNGFRVEGLVKAISRISGRLMFVTWADCSVSRGAIQYFEPSWGEFDMPVGEAVVSVFGGPADRGAYGEFEMGGVTTQPGRASPFTAFELQTFDLYSKIRSLREDSLARPPSEYLLSIVEGAKNDWLILIEILEFLRQRHPEPVIEKRVLTLLNALASENKSAKASLIENGIRIATCVDFSDQ